MSAIDKILKIEPWEKYHKSRATHLGSHSLADFRECPALYFAKKTGEIVQEEIPAFLIGRAVHTLVLEGDEVFSQQFVTGGPVNPKTGSVFGEQSAAYKAWANDMKPKSVLSPKQYELVTSVGNSVREHALASEVLSHGLAERVCRAKYDGVKAQARIDWFSGEYGIVDLKTCGDLKYFESDARRFNYAHQLAFYRTVLRLAAKDDSPMPCHLIGVEKQEPYRVGVWRVDDTVIDAAEKDNDSAVRRLKQCVIEERWPTGYEEMRVMLDL